MFKVTGVSRRTGVFKVRFAEDMSRLDVLTKNHHDEINLIEMPTAVDKAGCVKFLKTTQLYTRPEYKEAIDAADAKYNGDFTVAVSSKKSVKKPKDTKPSLEAIKARVAKTEATNNAINLPATSKVAVEASM